MDRFQLPFGRLLFRPLLPFSIYKAARGGLGSCIFVKARPHPLLLISSFSSFLLANSVMDAKKSHWVLIKDQFLFFALQSRSITDQSRACETKSTPGSCSLLLHYCLRCVVKTVDGIPEIKALGFQQH